MKNIITNYRRIQPWENFFLDSAIVSVGQAVGITFEHGFQPISAVTGDLFSYMYSAEKPCDSGLTNYFFDPKAVESAYALFGYSCIYFSSDQIKADLQTALHFIRESIDRGVPVLAWGCGHVITNSGACCDPMPEGCLIGGYEDDLLYVNLYPGKERLAETSARGKPGVDEYGYTAIDADKALATTYGIFILGDKIQKPEEKTLYRDILYKIPGYLTKQPTDGYFFGKDAFDQWSAVLRNDSYWPDAAAAEANCWDKHCCAYCSLCTSLGVGEGGIMTLIEKMAQTLPDVPQAAAIVPLFAKLQALNQAIWDTQGGFMPPFDQLYKHEYRENLAGILDEMGLICSQIAALFSSI